MMIPSELDVMLATSAPELDPDALLAKVDVTVQRCVAEIRSSQNHWAAAGQHDQVSRTAATMDVLEVLHGYLETVLEKKANELRLIT